MTSSSGASQIICAVLVACITGCILMYFRVKKKEIIKTEIVTKDEVSKSRSNNIPPIKYDLFVSFHGKDIRDTFLSHLIEAFARRKINAFVDDKLETGEDIWLSLVEAIKGSSISLIIFSENYAFSHWCLEELVKILECKEKYGRIVVPIFYNVEPSNVRHQRGSYENAFTELEKRYDFPRVQIWRQALTSLANLSGITSLKYRNDADLLEEIINRVLMSMPKYPVNRKRLIGMEKPIADLESLLWKESTKAHIIGIWGMGGIGKTTIVEEIFGKKCFEYGGSCFLSKVKDKLQKEGIQSLKEKLFSKLLAEDVKIYTPNLLPSDIEKRIGRMKVLIVLDDVNDTDQVENIFGTVDWLHSGSRIIITTRDKQVLISNKVDDIYQIGELSYSEALELFNLSAFNQIHLEQEYDDLSQRVVNYAKGIPLVLKVLGRLLCEKGKEVWESQLDKLKKISIEKVHEAMRVSYDDLDRREKNILLDIACFFNDSNMTMSSLISLLKYHENDNSVAVGLERLKDRALVTISKDNFVSMHEIIQEMGREIVRQESEDPGLRSRLWDSDDIRDVLKNNKGTEAIRSIIMYNSSIQNLKLSRYVFAKMSKLQFLKIQGGGRAKRLDLFLPRFKAWPPNLKYLFWFDCPLGSLPTCFSAESLVRLELRRGRMQRIWHGVMNLVNLKKVSLAEFSFLEELPDFSKALNLEYLHVVDCVKLKSVHPSIYSLNKLQNFILKGCVSLAEFTSDTRLSSLWLLDLTSCTGLRKLSVSLENITDLHLRRIPSNVFPSSFVCQSKLELLDLRETQYESLPSSIKNLTRLQELYISDCALLQSIPVLPPSIQILIARGCRSLKTVFFPLTAAEQFKENRQKVSFRNCMNLDGRSLRDIELNAQINLMKLTYLHSSTLEHKDESPFQAWYEYPGWSGVPKWLQFKTRNDEMIIDLSPARLSPLLGFIFCFILVAKDSSEYSGPIKFEITIINGEGKKGYVMDSDIATGNQCLIYDKKCSQYLTGAAKNQTRFKIKVATHAVKSKMAPMKNLKLIEFGVSPVSTMIYQRFVESLGLAENELH
ncbi:disease resistance-like protein DSC1 [Lotus japonicus]|uniref:disease resistance-like protein DSC1 n=1 Tax=Lotus japonicus TaxID=34305 RepID=UPI002589E09F|nr:disease resistance-like protein DSC1 [Lotus japonicus]